MLLSTAPTLAQVNAATPGSLIDFLLAAPLTQDAGILYGLVLGCTFGMFMHYFVKWMKKEIEGSLFNYLFRQNPRNTVLTIFSIVVWSAGECGLGLFTTDSGAFVGWSLVLLSGFKTGYTGDSMVNKAATIDHSVEDKTAKSKET